MSTVSPFAIRGVFGADAAVIVKDLEGTELLRGAVDPNGRFALPVSEPGVILGGKPARRVAIEFRDREDVLVGLHVPVLTPSSLRVGSLTVLWEEPPAPTTAGGVMLHVRFKVERVDGGTPSGPEEYDVELLEVEEDDTDLATDGTSLWAASGRVGITYDASFEVTDGSLTAHGWLGRSIMLRATVPTTGEVRGIWGPLCNPGRSTGAVLVVSPTDVTTTTAMRDADEFAALPDLSVLETNFDSEDVIANVACRRGMSAEQVRAAAFVYRLVDAGVIGTATEASARAFYGLARTGELMSSASIGLASRATLEERLTQAVDRGFVDVDVTDSSAVDDLVDQILAWRLNESVVDTTAPSPPPQTELGELLTTGGLSPAVARSYVSAAVDKDPEQTWDDFWSDLAPTVGASADRLRFAVVATQLTAGYLPLVTVLQNDLTTAVPNSHRHPARYTASDWETLLETDPGSGEIGAPTWVSGATAGERKTNYASMLADTYARVYPTEAVAYQVSHSATTAIQTFIDSNPTFDFGNSRVEDFVDEVGGGAPAVELAGHLRHVQRLFTIAPARAKVQAVQAMLDAGVNSALQLYRLGAHGTEKLLSGPLGGTPVACQIYSQAEQVVTTIASLTNMVKLDFHWGSISPSLGDEACKLLTEGMKTLFGSPDFCECNPCRSVFSPAAYLVELLQWLASIDPAVPEGSLSMREVLAERRPDIEKTELTCANTENVMPAIDLVNELLEREVRWTLDSEWDPASEGGWPQTTWRSDELMAQPEHLDSQAYSALASLNVGDGARLHPWNLPFSLHLYEARTYLDALRVPRRSLIEVMRHFPVDTAEAPPLAPNVSVRNELLGLTWAVQQLIVDPLGAPEDVPPIDPRETHQLWGLGAAGDLPTLQLGATLLERTQLSFGELQELLAADPFAELELGYEGDPCQLDNLRVFEGEYDDEALSWTQGTAEVMQSFLRLRAATGWTTPQLDATLRATGSTFAGDGDGDGDGDGYVEPAVAEAVLDRLAHVARLHERFPRLAWSEILSWVGPIDTKRWAEDEASYYELLVRPSMQAHPCFAEMFTGATPDETLPEIQSALLGILRLSDADYLRLLPLLGLTESSVISLATLSQLWRVASLSRALRLSIEELLEVLALSELDETPFSGALAINNDGTSILTQLIELCDELREWPMSTSAISFALRGQYEVEFGLTAADRAQALVAMITALQATRDGEIAKAPDSDLPVREQVNYCLERVFAGETLVTARALWDGTHEVYEETSEEIEDLVDEVFDGIVSAPVLAELYLVLGSRTTNWEATQGPVAVLDMLAFLLSREVNATAVRSMSTYLQLPEQDALTLLERFEHDGGPTTALALFTDEDFYSTETYDAEADAAQLSTDNFAKDFLYPADIERPQSIMLRRLARAAAIVRAAGIRDRDLRWMLGERVLDGSTDRYSETSTAMDLEGLPVDLESSSSPAGTWATRLEQLRWLFRATRISPTLATDTPLWTFLDIFALGAAATPVVGMSPDVLAPLTLALDVDDSLVTGFLDSHAGIQIGQLRDLKAVVWLQDAIALTRQVGVDAKSARGWGQGADPVDPPSIWDYTETTPATAQAIRAAAQAKHDPTAWLSAARPIRNKIRVLQRDALVAWLRGANQFMDGDASFVDAYMMDVLVAPCVVTTRLRHALTAVQLFVQRGMLALDSELKFDETHAQSWEWMARYRIWEANQKVFLYPENWLNPELRANPSAEFKTLMNELSAGELKNDAAEAAYTRFLQNVHAISNLRPCGILHEVEDAFPAAKRDILHYFARQRSEPSKVYYRKRVNGGAWTPWEPVPADMGAGDVLPVAFGGRLHVFWPTIQPTEEPGSEEDGPATQIDNLGLNWVTLGADGWAEPRVGRRKSRLVIRKNKKGFRRLSRIAAALHSEHADDVPVHVSLAHDVSNSRSTAIRVFASYGGYQGTTDEPWDANNQNTVNTMAVGLAGRFVYDPCTQDFGLDRSEVAAEPVSANNYWVSSWESADDPKIIFMPSFLHMRPRQMHAFRQGFTDIIAEPGEASDHRYLDVPLNYWQGGTVISNEFFVDESTVLYSGPIVWTRRPGRLYALPQQFNEYGIGAGVDTIKPRSPWTRTFCVSDGKGSFVVFPATESTVKSHSDSLSIGGGKLLMQGTGLGQRYLFESHYHPFTCPMLAAVSRGGVKALLGTGPDSATDPESFYLQSRQVEIMGEPTESPEPRLEPEPRVLKPYPVEDFDFSYRGAYAQYNWELFLHAPLLIAQRLIDDGQYSDAQRWLHFIFDPTRVAAHVHGEAPSEVTCRELWRVKPLVEATQFGSADDLWLLLTTPSDELSETQKAKQADLQAQFDASRANPFQPHLIAGLRPQAYKVYVFMKYLDLLIAWGDSLFAQDTLESVNEAFPHYLFAHRLLGRRPIMLPPRGEVAVLPDEVLDQEPPNWFKGVENMLGLSLKPLPNTDSSLVNTIGLPAELDPMPCKSNGSKLASNSFALALPGELDELEGVFCVPPNSKLLAYWDIVEDRLYKIRNCLSLAGVFRTLAPFDPPIDPGAIISALASGLDLGAAISAATGPRPAYRFTQSLGLAKELVGEVSRLAQAVLAAHEKRDGEALALLRQRQEQTMLSQVRDVRKLQIREAEEALTSARHSLASAEVRRDFYTSREFTNSRERESLETAQVASRLSRDAANLDEAAIWLRWAPSFSVGTTGLKPTLAWTLGPAQYSAPTDAEAARNRRDAASLQAFSGRTSTIASYQRRRDDWRMQADVAKKDIQQLAAQVRSAEIRLDTAKRELANHDLQTRQSAEMLSAMQTKYTNESLYVWMAGELGRHCFMAYKAAYELARRAERAYQFEMADPTGRYITFGHWDNRRKGQLAAEALSHELRRLELAYFDQNRREYELTKRVSLSMLDPALVQSLREGGSCEFTLPEWLFDIDFPSHYLRRIRAVSVSIPGVTGAFTTVAGRLTYHRGELRRSTSAEGTESDLWAAAESIAVSTNNEDTGLFDPNLRDERYLPFEGKGLVNSQWTLSLPADLRTFDYHSISDAVITIRYTAREGGDVFGSDRTTATKLILSAGVGEEPIPVLYQPISLRAEFPEVWSALVAAMTEDESTLVEFELPRDRFPYWAMPLLAEYEINYVNAYFSLREPGSQPASTSMAIWESGATEPSDPPNLLSWAGVDVRLLTSGTSNFGVGATLTVPVTLKLRLSGGWEGLAGKAEDLLLVFRYTASEPT